jgi:hypothetical protein
MARQSVHQIYMKPYLSSGSDATEYTLVLPVNQVTTELVVLSHNWKCQGNTCVKDICLHCTQKHIGLATYKAHDCKS